jgi:excisionase family DNA binding protein
MKNNKDEILSLSEAAEFLKVSKSCIYKLTSAKKIPHFVPGGKRIYFKKSDLENWILQNRITPVAEIESKTESYLSRNINTSKL